jgi:hypothetical protein
MMSETLKVRAEGGVLFTEIAVRPMNLLGPALVRDLVSLIRTAEADGADRVCSSSPPRTTTRSWPERYGWINRALQVLPGLVGM